MTKLRFTKREMREHKDRLARRTIILKHQINDHPQVFHNHWVHFFSMVFGSVLHVEKRWKHYVDFVEGLER